MKVSKVFIALVCCMMLSNFYGCSETGNTADTPNIATQAADDSSSENANTFPVNEFGQTYGTIPDPDSVSDALPLDA